MEGQEQEVYSMIILWIVLGILLIALIAGVVSLILIYNKLVTLSSRVDNSWAQVNVQLKKRFDLIPNLVETVKGVSGHESSLLKEITELRGTALLSHSAEESVQNNAQLSRALTQLIGIAEGYPELRSNENFLYLQHELSDVEKKIAVARQFYNDTCMMYNEYMDQFPGVLLAQLLHYEHRPYFEAYENEKEYPSVSF